MPIAEDVSIEELVDLTDNYSGADLEMLCREAGMLALRAHIKPGMPKEELILDKIAVDREHFELARSQIKPHISKEIMDEYTRIMRDFEVY
jgi:transitional endoplasmic reticulum ATPase